MELDLTINKRECGPHLVYIARHPQISELITTVVCIYLSGWSLLETIYTQMMNNKTHFDS